MRTHLSELKKNLLDFLLSFLISTTSNWWEFKILFLKTVLLKPSMNFSSLLLRSLLGECQNSLLQKRVVVVEFHRHQHNYGCKCLNPPQLLRGKWESRILSVINISSQVGISLEVSQISCSQGNGTADEHLPNDDYTNNLLHPRKLTWNVKISPCKKKDRFQRLNFRRPTIW